MPNHDPKQIHCDVTDDHSARRRENLEQIIEDIYVTLASHASTLSSHAATLANHESRILALELGS